MINKTRINKYLAEAGICSRRKADELILAGKIKINKKIAEPGDCVDDTDEIYYNDKLVESDQEKVYIVLNKPAGVISAAIDAKGRKKVTDFAPKNYRLYPIGRLDEDSEGLIILTNDGDLAQKLSHPSYQHEKEYKVWIDRGEKVDFDKIKSKMTRGLSIEGKLMKADSVDNFHMKTKNGRKFVTFNVILHTGHNRQIRKMCGKIGLSVSKLVRIRIGKLELLKLNLGSGQTKKIMKNDII